MPMKDESYLPIPDGAQEIIRNLNENGFEAYIVGGCVRDMLLGKQPHDWDICTSAKPEEVEKIFSDFRIIETGIQHGTVTIILNDGSYEVTTFRIDGNYSDNRHPDSVVFTPLLEEDLARRDFTMNAIAYNHRCELADPFHGAEDLSFGIIRCVGDPEQRFQEDGLRIMRAIRFASTYQFELEPNTEAAVFHMANLLNGISAERLRDELCKLLLGDGVENVLIRYRDVIAQIIPELRATFECPQNNPWHHYDVYRHTVKSVSHAKRNLTLRLTMLLHDIGKPISRQTDEDGTDHFYGHPMQSAEMADKILKRLKFDNVTRNNVVELVRNHDIEASTRARFIRKMLSRLGQEQFSRWLDIKTADRAAQSESIAEEETVLLRNIRCLAAETVSKGEPLSLKDLKINGNDLLAEGMKPGPEIGIVLRSLMELVLSNPDLNTKERLLAEVKTMGYIKD